MQTETARFRHLHVGNDAAAFWGDFRFWTIPVENAALLRA
jgi:hypothetical protein